MPMRFTLPKAERIVDKIALLIVSFLLLPPLLFLVIQAFEGYPPTFSSFLAVFSNKIYFELLGNTLLVSVGASLLALALGLPLAWIVARTNTPLRGVFETVLIVNFFTPILIGAVAWSALASPQTGLLNYLFLRPLFGITVDVYNLYGIIFVMGLYLTPTVFIFITSALKSMAPAYEEASVMCGASDLHTAFHITLPMVTPSILSSFLLVFAFSTSIFSAPALLGVRTGFYTLVYKVYELTRSYPPEYSIAAVLSIMLVLLSILGTYLHNRALRGREFITVTGRGFQHRLVDLKRWKYIGAFICTMYFVIAVLLPIFGLVICSLQPFTTATLGNLTFSNWSYVFQQPMLIRSIRNSLLIAVTVATLVTALTLVVAYAVTRMKTRVASALGYINMIPITIPHASFAIAMIFFWLWMPEIGVYGTIWIIIMGLMAYGIPYGVRSIASGIGQIDRQLEEASRTSGASWSYTMAHILLPLLKSTVFSTWILIFVHTIKDLTITLFLYSYGTETMPIVLFNLWSEGGRGYASVIALLMILASLGTILVATRVFKLKISPLTGT
ncbi:iron ABC transporter permease [Candidatus Bathyarchaeota archaeon]|nr:iron ABC transporter permease [Candidatus Bathyarchaeota archaeon]